MYLYALVLSCSTITSVPIHYPSLYHASVRLIMKSKEVMFSDLCVCCERVCVRRRVSVCFCVWGGGVGWGG